MTVEIELLCFEEAAGRGGRSAFLALLPDLRLNVAAMVDETAFVSFLRSATLAHGCGDIDHAVQV